MLDHAASVSDRSGSDYLNNRYHDPTLGAFISVDPLVSATGEPYIYGKANPIAYSDPSGLKGCDSNHRCPGGPTDRVRGGVAGSNSDDSMRSGLTLTQIYENFHVDSRGPKVTYRPGCLLCPLRLLRFAGMFPEVEVTQAEADLLDGFGALQLRSLDAIKVRAIQAGLDYAQVNGIEAGGTRADAVRHAYWNGLLVREVGRDLARDLASAHEQVVGNFQADEAMDLWNNLQGRAIASSNPGATEAELLQLIIAAVETGQMVVIRDAGSLAWSSDFVGTFLPRAATPPSGVHDEYHNAYGPVLG